jgi:hypothetical protein
MKLIPTLLAATAAFALAACEGQADENLGAAAGNVADAVGEGVEGAAAGAVNLAEDAGQAIGNGADAVGNRLDEVDADGNAAANATATNSQ